MTDTSYVFKTEEAANEWIKERKQSLMVYSPIFSKPYFCEHNKGWIVTMTMFGAD